MQFYMFFLFFLMKKAAQEQCRFNLKQFKDHLQGAYLNLNN